MRNMLFTLLMFFLMWGISYAQEEKPVTVTIVIPAELVEYKDAFVAYAMEAIEIKKTEDDWSAEKKPIKDSAISKVEKVKIDGKEWGTIKSENASLGVGE